MLCSSILRTQNSTLTRLKQSLLENLPLNPAPRLRQNQQRKRSNATKEPPKICGGAPAKKKIASQSKDAPQLFNTARPRKDPPDEGYQPDTLNHIAFEAPEFLTAAIFRPFEKCDEQLGPDASKGGTYKNTEYFSYHRFSFVEIQKQVLELRKQRICSDNVKCVYDYESDDENDGCENDVK